MRTGVCLSIGFGIVQVALGDIGAPNAHLPNLSHGQLLILFIQDCHLQRQL
jgi:hypothetical protein